MREVSEVCTDCAINSKNTKYSHTICVSKCFRNLATYIFYLLLGLLNRSTNFIQLPPGRIKNLICKETHIRDLTVQAKKLPTQQYANDSE